MHLPRGELSFRNRQQKALAEWRSGDKGKPTGAPDTAYLSPGSVKLLRDAAAADRSITLAEIAALSGTQLSER